MDKLTFDKLVSGLIKKTQSNEIEWKKTSGEDEYKVQLSTSAVTVDKFMPSQSNYHIYDLVVYNSNGEAISRVYYDRNEPSEFDTEKLTKLHNLVTNNYYKIDKTFDDILKELE